MILQTEGCSIDRHQLRKKRQGLPNRTKQYKNAQLNAALNLLLNSVSRHRLDQHLLSCDPYHKYHNHTTHGLQPTSSPVLNCAPYNLHVKKCLLRFTHTDRALHLAVDGIHTLRDGQCLP